MVDDALYNDDDYVDVACNIFVSFSDVFCEHQLKDLDIRYKIQ